jgi:hypothetical protein
MLANSVNIVEFYAPIVDNSASIVRSFVVYAPIYARNDHFMHQVLLNYHVLRSIVDEMLTIYAKVVAK